MSFVNERIPEARKGDLAELKDSQTHQPLSLYMWTVDEGRDVFLIRSGQDRENPERVSFVFSVCGVISNIRVIERIAPGVDGESFTYDLESVSFPDHASEPPAQFKALLRDALKTLAGLYGTVKVSAVKCEF